MNYIRVDHRRFLSNLLRLITVIVTVLSSLPLPVEAAEAPIAAPAAGVLLPAWMDRSAAASPDLLPSWLTAHPPAPAARRLALDIPQSLLQVLVTGPTVASLGSPIGSGEIYTAVIRNTSAMTAYNYFLSAGHPTFFTYDGGAQLTSSSGAVPFTTLNAAGLITWTPTLTTNLAPGEVITLNFRLRAACDAQSGQMMRVYFHYNADPAQPPTETNTGGLNITTGRGNLTIKKLPALQNLGTPDFGRPITWFVTVQNTGLGVLYDAVITDTGGINLGQPTGDLVPSATIPALGINEIQTFTVVGRVEACNFTNVAQGSWTCGNLVGDATPSRPLTTTASILFTPEVPQVHLAVSTPITEPYCTPVTRTVTLTLTNPGGPAGNFRIDSTFEADGYWQVLTPTLGAGWQYLPGTGVFNYTGGSPTGTLANTDSSGPQILSFQIRPQAARLCGAESGTVVFTPLYQDVCSSAPFTGTPILLDYDSAQDGTPTLNVDKTGPALVTVGEIFTYSVTLFGENPQNISGTIWLTDVVPAEFDIIGPVSASAGTIVVAGQTLTWTYDPPSTPGPYTITLLYPVRAITTTGGACGASQAVRNAVQATAQPLCPGCAQLNDSDYVDTIIQNLEGVSSGQGSAGGTETCGPGGLTISRQFMVTGTTAVTWTGAVFTEALGTPIGAGALAGPVYLQYVPGSLVLRVNGVDYSAQLTPTVTPGGQLLVDLSPLQTAIPTVPTQNLTLTVNYLVTIPEAVLNGVVDLGFYDWAQLYLPGISDQQACAANRAFNQALPLTIGRADLALSLDPPILNRCGTNPVTLTVHDTTPGRLTHDLVVTFTASTAEILSARNFRTSGNLPPISAVTVETNSAIGGGLGIITFTFASGFDLNGDGAIHFDIDLNCSGGADWHAGAAFLSRCNWPHQTTTALSHAYRSAGLLLFATPIRYTVREKQVLWKFFISNNGNTTATTTLVTNQAAGLSITGYQAGPGVTISGTLPIASPSPAVFTITNLAPGEMRAVTVTADVIACSPLHVDISAIQPCFGQVCAQPQARVDFETPDPYLLTNNGETADLPMCDVGEVVFTTKNASADVSLYNLTITETLRGLLPVPGAPMTLTIVDERQQQLVQTLAFTPEQQSSGGNLLLIWKPISAPTEVLTWFNALPPLYVVRVRIPVRTDCVPPAIPQSFAAASAQGPCGKDLGYTEDAVTLHTLQPDMTILKEGAVAGGTFGKQVYAQPGDTIVWRITVQNRLTDRSYVAHNVVLSDTWPYNFNFITATTTHTPTIQPAQRTITWAVGDMVPGASQVFYITGTVDLADGACSPQTQNLTRLRFGCDSGCASSLTPIDTADLGSQPDLRLLITPDPLNICGGDIPITLRNYGTQAYSTTFTLTVPSGYVYDSLVNSGLAVTAILTDPTTPRFQWDTIPGRPGPGAPYEFTMTVRLRSDGSAGTTCPWANGQPITGTLQYENHPICLSSGPFFTQTAANLSVQQPQLTLSKTPHDQPAAVGGWVTWTVFLTNTGNGLADNVVVTDVAGSNYNNVTATAGSDGALPLVAGNLITWPLAAPLPAGAVWTAQVSARLLDIGLNLNVVTATAACDSGCTSATAAGHAHTTLLQQFAKYPDIQTATLGSLVVFSFTTAMSDYDALYEATTLTDTLPTGLGYVGSWLEYTVDGDAASQNFISTTPTLNPLPGASGPVVWQLGDLPGTVMVSGVITTVVQNIPANQGGLSLTNRIALTYVDDTTPYVYTDTARVDLEEPRLGLDKSVASSTGSVVNLDGNAWLTYTLRLTNTGSSPAYDVMITDTLPAGISVTALYGGDSHSAPLQGPGTLTWTVAVMSETLPTGLNNPLILTYTARISGAVSNLGLTNRVTATASSLPDTPANERTYPLTDTETVTTSQITFVKTVSPPSSASAPLRLGDIVTYTIVTTVPAGLRIPWPFLYDDLPSGVHVLAGTFQTASSLPYLGPDPLASAAVYDSRPNGVQGITATTNPRIGRSEASAAVETIEWWLDPLDNSLGTAPRAVTATFQAQLTGVDLIGTVQWTDPQAAPALNNTARIYWNNQDSGSYSSTLPTQTLASTATSYVGQPLAHINKTYVTPAACQATLLEDAFNRPSTTPPTGWISATGTWNQNGTAGYARQSSNSTANALLIRTGFTAADFSYSAMVRSTDTTPSSYGLAFRYTDPNNYYRLRLRLADTPTLTNRLELERISSGAVTSLGTYPITPTVERWYHLEVRYERARIRAYVDGILLIDIVDSAPLAAGSVGFYANACNTNSCQFDDAFVTRLETTGCYVGAGDLVTYTLTISNQGTMPAYDLVISDVLPAELTFVSSALLSAPAGTNLTAQPAPGATGTITWGVDVLPGTSPGAFAYANQQTLRLQVVTRVTDTVPAGTFFSNQVFLPYYDSQPGAGITGTLPITGTDVDERIYTDGSHSAGLQTTPPGLIKTVVPISATLGEIVTYVVTLPAAPISATLYEVTLTDTLDPRLMLASLTDGPDGVTATAGNAFTVTYPAIPAGEQRRVTVTAVLSDPLGALAGQVITNAAILTHTQGTTLTPPISFTVREPALTLVKGSTPPTSNTVAAGQHVTYTVDLTNSAAVTAGPAYDLVFTDTLPLGMRAAAPTLLALTLDGTPVSGSDYTSPTFNAATGAWVIDFVPTFNLLPGSVLRIQYVATVDGNVPAGVDLTNHAAASASSLPGPVSGDRPYGPLTDTTTVHAGWPALDLEKNALPGPVEAGDRLTYTLTVTNTGPVNANGTVITDAVPANTSYLSCDPLPCGESSGIVSWTLGTLPAGASTAVTLVVRITPPLTNGTWIANTAWVTTTEGITTTDAFTVPVSSRHFLTVTKTAALTQATAGDPFTYTLAWTVSGNEPAPDVTLSDPLPANTTYLACEGGATCGLNGSTVLWTLGTVNPPDTGVVTLVVRIDAPLPNGTVITNTAAITDATALTVTTTHTTPVVSSHALAITKTAALTQVTAGSPLTYTLAWEVSGNEPAPDVTLSDPLPANTTYITCSPLPCSESNGIVSWTLGTVDPFDTGVVTLVVQTATPLPNGTVITNTAAITDATALTVTTTHTTPVVSSHALAVTKTAAITPATAGEPFTYTLAWEVSGNEPAPDVTLSDPLPANTTYITCSPLPCGESNGIVSWTLGTVNPPDTDVVTLVVRIAAPLPNGTVITNTAAITDATALTVTTTHTTPVVSNHALAITKTAALTPATAGDPFTYTLAWEVSGNEPAPDVTLSDPLPANTTYVACSPLPCGESNGIVSWTLGTVNPPDTDVVTLVVRIDSALPAGASIVNRGIITDSTGVTDTDTLTTFTTSMADLLLTKAATPDPVIPGTALVYTLVYTNMGPSAAENVIVYDLIAPELSFVGSNPPPSGGPPPLVFWALGTVPAGTGGRIVVTTTVRPDVALPITNTASITTTTPDQNPSDNNSTVTTTVLVPGLEMTKRVAPGLVTPGMPFTYTIRVTNTGQVAFDPLVLTDTLPANINYVVGSGIPADPDLTTPALIWQNLGPLAPGAVTQVSFMVTATQNITGIFINIADIRGDHPGGSITATDSIPTVIQDPALIVDKQLTDYDRDSVYPNYVTFTIQITNIGPSIIDVLPMVDLYDPANLSFVRSEPQPDEPQDDGILGWYDLTAPPPTGFGHNLLPGATLLITTVFTAVHDITTTSNTALVTGVVDIYQNGVSPVGAMETITGVATAVELLYFRATDQPDGVLLEWETATEIDNFGFRIFRGTEPEFTRASEVTFIPSDCRGTRCGAAYRFTDTAAESGRTYHYWLVDVDTWGMETVHEPVQVQVGRLELPWKLYLPLILRQ